MPKFFDPFLLWIWREESELFLSYKLNSSKYRYRQGSKIGHQGHPLQRWRYWWSFIEKRYKNKKNIYNTHLPKMLHLFEKRIMDYVIPTCIIHIFVLRIRTVFYIPCVLKHFRFIQKKCFCGFPFRGINYIVQMICKSVLKFKRHNWK